MVAFWGETGCRRGGSLVLGPLGKGEAVRRKRVAASECRRVDGLGELKGSGTFSPAFISGYLGKWRAAAYRGRAALLCAVKTVRIAVRKDV
jgi:hypothetical protein